MSVRKVLVLGSLLVLMASSGACSSHGDEPQANAAGAPSTPMFVDDFDQLDTGRWMTGIPHQLGRSQIDPRNVAVSQGTLRLGLTGGKLDGAELRTQGAVPRGVYRARLMAANAPDSVTGFFLYSPPDLAHEVDIELYNRPEGRVRLTTYDAGKMTSTREVALPFDPTADDHEYAIALTSDGVEFYADSALLGSWSAGVPDAPMNLYLNTWYPQWLGGVPAPRDQATFVEQVSVQPR